VEFFDFACAIDEAVCVVPSVIRVVALPFSLVLEYAILDSTGEDTSDGVLWLSVDFNRWRRGFNLTG
jgi:hypothetical protein